RRRHPNRSNEYFDRAQTRHQNYCRSASPMSLMGQNPLLPRRNLDGRSTSTSGLSAEPVGGVVPSPFSAVSGSGQLVVSLVFRSSGQISLALTPGASSQSIRLCQPPRRPERFDDVRADRFLLRKL